jgi:cytochrome c oxidase subunit 1
VTPVLIGAFGNFLIPLMIGARDMAFPRLNMYSFWTFLVSQLLVVASFFTDLGTGGAGWTNYAPLSTQVGMPGTGQTLVIVALFVTGASSTMGAINYVTTVIRLRAPGMTWGRLPLTIWALWLTAILNALFVPVLGAAALLLDRHFGTRPFIAGLPCMAWRPSPTSTCWIRHPEVHHGASGLGIVGDVLSFFAGKPQHWYRARWERC